MSDAKPEYTACVILIGNELLSGRTKDANLAHIAETLNEWGVRLREARVIADVEATIVATVNECRAAYDYVFTTGGIGPTHDDITAASIAKAFGVGLEIDQKTFEAMAAHYDDPADFNEARQKMCYIPEGASLIENAVSTAPGFQIENVFVMAGIPSIMRAMMDTLKNRLVGGQPVRSRTVNAFLPEGAVAAGLAAVQDAYPGIDIGSYPFYNKGRFGTSLVLRGTEDQPLDEATGAVADLVTALGETPHLE